MNNINKFFRFRDLQNYTTLKRQTLSLCLITSFRDLQNYTTLKLIDLSLGLRKRFRDLQNYTTLKPQIKFEAQE